MGAVTEPTWPTPGASSDTWGSDLNTALHNLVLQLPPIASPNFTGTPTAPTPAVTDSSTALVTTAWVQNFGVSALLSDATGRLGQIAQRIASTDLNNLIVAGFYNGDSLTNGPTAAASGNWYYVFVQRHSNSASYVTQMAVSLTNSVPLAYQRSLVSGTWSAWRQYAFTDSPALTGTPTVPTPATADASTKIASTQFVYSAISAQQLAPLASPAFTGTPTAPTVATGDSSTSLATTAWVKAQGYGTGASGMSNPMTTSGDVIYGGASGAATRLGANTTGANQFLRSVSSGTPSWSAVALSDVSGAAGLASPAFTGTPTAPTPANNTNSTQIATTAFVENGDLVLPNPQSASYTLAASDNGVAVEGTSGSAMTITVPAGVFAVGAVIEITQYGAGQITLAAASGVTLRTPASLTTRAQYSTLALRCRASNEFIVSGDMS